MEPSQPEPCMICKELDFELMKSSNWEVAGSGNVQICFGICRNCGHIHQNPCPSGKVLDAIYVDSSSYFAIDAYVISPDIPQSPTSLRLVDFAARHKPERGTIYEIGCGNGRQLVYLQRDGWQVTGCEPSAPTAAQASQILSAEIEVGYAKPQFKDPSGYDIVLLSHVLEHVTDPRDLIETAKKNLKKDGVLLIEIPCIREAKFLCPGWLQIEHLSYFSENLIIQLLEEAGMEILETQIVDINRYINYPTITIACKKAQKSEGNKYHFISDYEENKQYLTEYITQDAAQWAGVSKHFEHVTDAYVWGAGMHTYQLFSDTDILERINVKGIIDSNPLKAGSKIGKYPVIDIDTFHQNHDSEHVIISSYCSENEIAESLKRSTFPHHLIVKLYEST